eukprot:1788773-Rhodomonas_salina.1
MGAEQSTQSTPQRSGVSRSDANGISARTDADSERDRIHRKQRQEDSEGSVLRAATGTIPLTTYIRSMLSVPDTVFPHPSPSLRRSLLLP